MVAEVLKSKFSGTSFSGSSHITYTVKVEGLKRPVEVTIYNSGMISTAYNPKQKVSPAQSHAAIKAAKELHKAVG